MFNAAIPTATKVNSRAQTKKEEQMEELLKSGRAFSASKQWNFCDSRIAMHLSPSKYSIRKKL
jgi:hypothetical protein